MNTLLDKIVAVAMMVGATMMFSVMAYNIVLMFGRTYMFKWWLVEFENFLAKTAKIWLWLTYTNS